MSKKTKRQSVEPRWARTGIAKPLAQSFMLTKDQQHHIIDVADAKEHPEAEAFALAIQQAVNRYLEIHEFENQTSPGVVRDRIKNLRDKATELNGQIQRLDDFSRHLLFKVGRGPTWCTPGMEEAEGRIFVGTRPDGSSIWDEHEGYSFGEAAKAVEQLQILADTALAANKFPKGGSYRSGEIRLACDVAMALKGHLQINPSTYDDGALTKVLRLIFQWEGVGRRQRYDSTGERNVRALVTTAVQHLTETNQ